MASNAARIAVLAALLLAKAVPAAADAGGLVDMARLCVERLMRPAEFISQSEAAGVRMTDGGAVAPGWSHSAFNRDDQTLLTQEIAFPDARTLICQITHMSGVELVDLERLRGIIANDPDIGRLDDAFGEPKINGVSAKVVIGAFKKPGSNPHVGLSITATERFTSFVITRTDYQK